MRRALIGGARYLRGRLFQAFVQRCDLARQGIDLLPLRSDGLVRRASPRSPARFQENLTMLALPATVIVRFPFIRICFELAKAFQG